MTNRDTINYKNHWASAKGLIPFQKHKNHDKLRIRFRAHCWYYSPYKRLPCVRIFHDANALNWIAPFVSWRFNTCLYQITKAVGITKRDDSRIKLRFAKIIVGFCRKVIYTLPLILIWVRPFSQFFLNPNATQKHNLELIAQWCAICHLSWSACLPKNADRFGISKNGV